MLLKLLHRFDRSRFSFHVFSLTTLGEIGPQIRELGVLVDAMGMSPGHLDPFIIAKLTGRLRDLQIDLVHTWMYHADLLGGIAAKLAGVRTIAWGIRNTNLDADKSKLLTRLVVKVNAVISHWVPTGILSCSDVARDVHIARGYTAAKMFVIPNGFDLSRFKPDLAARHSVRSELQLRADTPLVGVVARYDPLKNHAGFLAAAGLLRRTRPDVHFILVGKDVDERNLSLTSTARRLGLADSVHWLGLRDDIPRLMSAFDVLAQSSFGEAFPNVLGEAMACGVPCAVTNVGDSASIVADTGRVVGSGDMPALAAAMEALLALSTEDRVALGQRARTRVEQTFEIGQIVRRYEEYYGQLAQISTSKCRQ